MNKLVVLSEAEAFVQWDEAEKHLQQAVENDSDVGALQLTKGRVLAGLNQLWKIEDEEGQAVAWATTYLYTADGEVGTAQIHLATGEALEAFLEQLDEFEHWAHERGISYIEVVGRFGWRKTLKPLGFSHNYTSLLKRVYLELH